jgi:predicted amidohydrolase
MAGPRMALWQTSGRPRDVGANLDALATVVGRAAAAGARPLVCPEMFLTGYAIGADVARLAEAADGPAARRVVEIAAAHGVGVVYGVVPTRAFENQLYVAYVNRHGPEGEFDFVGQSRLAGPDGVVRARAGHGEESLIADVDLESPRASRAANPYSRDRRPELYAALTSSSRVVG